MNKPLLLLAYSVGTALAQPYDVVITGGRVLDGTGNPAVYADVAIRDGKIAAVGRVRGAAASRTIDAKGKYVCPGFIDLHSHADRGLASGDRRRRSAPNLVSQGITTVCVNPDGASPWPLSAQFATYERLGIGPNAVLMPIRSVAGSQLAANGNRMIGHGTVRRLVMKDDFKRPATAKEIRKMRELVRLGMQKKAFGLSAELEYVLGIWSEISELIELVREIVPFGGVYSVHERSESTDPRWYQPSVG